MTGPGPHSTGGFLQATSMGAGVGGVTGGAGAAAGHGLETVGGRMLSHVEATPQMPGPYDGVREASQYLQEQGVPRQFRQEALESFTRAGAPTGQYHGAPGPFQIPEGTRYLSGEVGPNFNQPGGGHQVYLPNSDVLIRQH